jgi:hypothetical protein
LPRLCGFPLPDLAERRLNRPAESSLRVRLPLEFCPANPSQRAATCRLLSWTLVPFSTSGQGSPLDAGDPSPATFRLQGLATLLTAYSFQAPADLVSCRQRSWDSPFRAFPSRKVSDAFPPQMDPHAVFPPGAAIAEAMARAGRPRLLGFDPYKSPLRPWHVFNTPARRMLPWVFSLPGHTSDSLDRDPSRSPLTRFFRPPE